MHKMSRIIAYFHHQFLFFNKHRQSNSKGIKYKYELKGLNYYCLNYHHFIKICSKFRSRFLEHGGQLGAGQHGAEGSGGGVQMGPTEHRRVRRRPEFRHAVRLQRGKLQHNVAHGLSHVEEFVPQGHLDERLGHQAGSLHGCRAARAEGTGAEAGPAVELSHRFHSLHVELFAREARGKLHEHVGQLDGTFRFTNEKKKSTWSYLLFPFSRIGLVRKSDSTLDAGRGARGRRRRKISGRATVRLDRAGEIPPSSLHPWSHGARVCRCSRA